MKFIKRDREVEVEWKDGAKIKLKIPLYVDLLKENPEINTFDSLRFGVFVLERSLVGWSEIVGADDKPLEFNEQNRKHVINELCLDTEMAEKVKKAFGGTLLNLVIGSTAS